MSRAEEEKHTANWKIGESPKTDIFTIEGNFPNKRKL